MISLGVIKHPGFLDALVVFWCPFCKDKSVSGHRHREGAEKGTKRFSSSVWGDFIKTRHIRLQRATLKPDLPGTDF